MGLINVPGLDTPVNFPEGMGDDDIVAAIKQHSADWINDAKVAKQASPTSSGFTEPFGGEAAGIATPATDKETTALKQGMYGNDAPGAILSGLGHFVGDVPAIGMPLKAGIERAAAGVNSLRFGTPYAEEVKNAQDLVEGASSAHPIAGVVGGIAGNTAALAPVAALAPAALGIDAAAPVLTNVARAARTGAALEGTQAAEEGKNPQQILTQGAVGAATFGAAPIVGAGVGAIVGKIMDKAAQVSGPMSGNDQRALEWAVTSLKNDNLLSDAAIDKRFDELGPHAFLAEYGPNTSGAASALGSLPGSGKTLIKEGFDTRQGGQFDRIDQGITNLMGPRVDVANLTAQGQVDRSDAARDLYSQWRSQQIQPTDELKALMPRLQAAGAFSGAQQRAAVQGVPWNQNFFTTGPQKAYPTAQSWDLVKQALDDSIAAQKNPLTGEMSGLGRDYTGLKKEMMEAIDNSNGPGAAIWKQARQAWADPTAVMRARAEGQAVWDRSVRRDELIGQLIDYSGPERAAFKQGARDSLAETMDNSLNGDTLARNKLLNRANQQKLDWIGTNKNVKSSDLVKQLEQEKAGADKRSQIIYNSETAGREAGQAMLTPDPTQTLTARLRAGYSPHVSPGSYLPKSLEDMAAQRQAQSFETSRDTLAPWLMKQGTDARDFAKALAAHARVTQPGATQIGPGASNMVNLLAQGGGAPLGTQALYPQIQQMLPQPQPAR